MQDLIKQKNMHSKSKYFYLFFWLLNFVLWFTLYWKMCVVNNNGDYYYHNLFASYIINGDMNSMYPGYHLIVGGIAKIFNVQIIKVSAIVLDIFMCLSVYISYLLLKEILNKKNYCSDLILLLFAFILNVVQPIFTSSIRPGYSSGNGYISPTQAACKPFILLAILLFYRMYKSSKWNVKSQIVFTLVLIISCIIKPVFAMAFVPSMGILLLVEEIIKLKKKTVKIGRAVLNYLKEIWPLFVTGLFLIAQYLYGRTTVIPIDTIYTERAGSSIRIGFLRSWSLVVSNVWVSIIFAYLFPLVVLCLYAYYKNKSLQKFNSGLIFYLKMCIFYGAVSFLYMAFLYQDNGYEEDCNFRNAWIVTFIMFFSLSISVLIKWIKEVELCNQIANIKSIGLRKIIFDNKAIFISIFSLSIHLLFGVLLLLKNIVF